MFFAPWKLQGGNGTSRPSAWVHLLAILFFIMFQISFCDVNTLTREEAAHTGLPFIEPKIIEEFEAFLRQSSSSYLKELNDFTRHHKAIQIFCQSRASGSCRWSEYYQILDSLRAPFVNSFDPGIKIGQPIHQIQERHRSGSSYQKKCQRINYPTAEEFLPYVLGSKPVIIKGALPREFKSALWSFSNLVQLIGTTEVSLVFSQSSVDLSCRL
jgi:hypothetical protein